jgi:tRNA1(Val) A37 N6-methylase TrmN6
VAEIGVRPAKRVVLCARKCVASPFLLHSGFVIHREDGHYTEAVEAVLRHNAALPPTSGGSVDPTFILRRNYLLKM